MTEAQYYGLAGIPSPEEKEQKIKDLRVFLEIEMNFALRSNARSHSKEDKSYYEGYYDSLRRTYKIFFEKEV